VEDPGTAGTSDARPARGVVRSYGSTAEHRDCGRHLATDSEPLSLPISKCFERVIHSYRLENPYSSPHAMRSGEATQSLQ